MKAIQLAGFSLLFVTFFASVSTAQQRTFVSGGGNDANACSHTAPCRTFAQAISKTSVGGEVIVLDSAGYGAFTITQAVSIIAPPGIYAGISVFSGDGITVNVGSSDMVTLRGLTINNQGSSGSGIVFKGGMALEVNSCVVSGFTGNGSSGIALLGSNAALTVKDSTIKDSSVGLNIAPSSGSATATVERGLVACDGIGAQISDGASASIRESVVSGTTVAGLFASSTTVRAAELNVENCLISNNVKIGIGASSSNPGVATVRVSNSTVTDNDSGLNNAMGGTSSILSRGNNTVEGNTFANTIGTIGSYNAK
jgi:hypothetical protein